MSLVSSFVHPFCHRFSPILSGNAFHMFRVFVAPVNASIATSQLVVSSYHLRGEIGGSGITLRT